MENNPFLWSLRFYSHYARVLMIKGDLGLRKHYLKPTIEKTTAYLSPPFYHKNNVMSS